MDKEIINVNTSYGNTFIIASGDKASKPVILLHGSSTNSVMWMGDVEKLSETYRVYAIDIIGESGKSDENRPDMNGDHYGKWLDEVIDDLNITKAIIIGNSLGGWMPLMLLGEKGIDRINQIVYGNEVALEFGKLIMKYYRPRMGSLPVFTDQELNKLTMPTLYMGGENDALLPTKKIADRISKLIPKGKITVLKNTGYVLINVVDDIVIFLGG